MSAFGVNPGTWVIIAGDTAHRPELARCWVLHGDSSEAERFRRFAETEFGPAVLLAAGDPVTALLDYRDGVGRLPVVPAGALAAHPYPAGRHHAPDPYRIMPGSMRSLDDGTPDLSGR